LLKTKGSKKCVACLGEISVAALTARTMTLKGGLSSENYQCPEKVVGATTDADVLLSIVE
jgi:hypothetical protein